MTDFLIFFTKRLRLSNPWNFKVPFLIAIPYLLLLLGNYNGNGLIFVLASVSIIIGIAGFGYLTNDLGDRNKDKLIQKQNVTYQLPVSGIISLFLFFLVLALAPWWYLPMNNWSYLLLGLQFFLFCVYAFPPFRFKERGFSGVVIDALYAHLAPALLAAHTFHLIGGQTFPDFFNFLVLLGGWQFILGIRNILFHQLKDLNDDLQSGTRTFVTSYGEKRTEQLLKKLLLPAEVILFIVFVVFVNYFLFFFLPAVILYWMIQRVKFRRDFRTMGYRKMVYVFLDDLYIQWVPLFILSGLVISSFQFIAITILHICIFRNGIKTLLLKYTGKLSERSQ
jgi:4-hydroxybenzoate polyprenyltransferase